MNIKTRLEEVVSRATCLFTGDDINNALDRMAAEMNQVFKFKNPVMLSIVLGGMVPMDNLLPRLTFPLTVDYIHASRYGDKTSGSNDIKISVPPSKSLKGRDVVIMDDILDEGITLAAVKEYCRQQGAGDIYSAVLLNKRKKRASNGLLHADFVGFDIDDLFVIGYGLDYNGYLRNLNGIYVVAKEDMDLHL